LWKGGLTVRLADFLNERCVFPSLESSDKKQLLEQMVSELQRLGLLSDAEECLHALLDREELMSTGVKKGFAIPHAFTDQLENPLFSIAMVRNGVDYQSLDGEPVSVVFLLLGPRSAQGIHLKMLARLSRLMNDKQFLDLMMAAQSSSELIDVVRSQESKLDFGDVG
jgi:fructose-specific phosphotransferase system IIA component